MTAIQCPGGYLVDDPVWRGRVTGFNHAVYRDMAKSQEEKDLEFIETRLQKSPAQIRTERRYRRASM